MSLPSHAKKRRARRGQHDQLVDPALSAKRRSAAAARWIRQGKAFTKEQVAHGMDAREPERVKSGDLVPRREQRQDLEVLQRVLARVGPQRIATVELLTSALPEAARAVVSIMRDTRQRGETRLAAARLVFEWGGLKQVAEAPMERPLEELTIEEIDNMIRDCQSKLTARATLAPAASDARDLAINESLERGTPETK